MTYKHENVAIVSGSRYWKDSKLMYDRLALLPERTTVIHGGCDGADLLAAGLSARYFEFPVIRIDYFGWMGTAGGSFRNQYMLDLLQMYKEKGSITHVIGFHSDLWGNSLGTKDMIRRAKVAKWLDHLDYVSGWCFQHPKNAEIGHPDCVGFIHHVWNGFGFVPTCSQEEAFCHKCGNTGYLTDGVLCHAS